METARYPDPQNILDNTRHVRDLTFFTNKVPIPPWALWAAARQTPVCLWEKSNSFGHTEFIQWSLTFSIFAPFQKRITSQRASTEHGYAYIIQRSTYIHESERILNYRAFLATENCSRHHNSRQLCLPVKTNNLWVSPLSQTQQMKQNNKYSVLVCRSMKTLL